MNNYANVVQANILEPIEKISFQDFEERFLSIPRDIVNFKKLKYVDFGEVPIDTESLKILVPLKELEVIKIRNYVGSEFPIGILLQLGPLVELTFRAPLVLKLPIEASHLVNMTYLHLDFCESLEHVIGIPPNLTYLNISNTKIDIRTEKILSLSSLLKLVAGGLGLKEIPKEIFKIKSLHSLFLPSNHIKTVPKEIAELDLSELYLDDNQFTDFPIHVIQLKKLHSLNLSENFLTSLPDNIIDLTNLFELNLSDNNFSEFPRQLTHLPNIRTISLGNIFNITKPLEKGLNRISVVPDEIINCENLHQLNLPSLDIENIPLEILASGYAAIRNFIISKKEADNEQYLFESKMVIVGRGNVGKTVLTSKLINPSYNLSESKSTLGINVLKVPFFLKIKDTDSQFKLNIWDFGGQEKYDATHQLFITKRSIYLFLTEAREESNYLDFYYWLNTIQLFGDNSPVVVVLSKCDERKKLLPESHYKEKFKNIVDFVDVSCAKGYETTIENLKTAITIAIGTLPQTQIKLSNRWVDVRNDIETLGKSKDYISYDAYLGICKKHNLDKERADFLSQYLHDLGVIIHHQSDVLLKRTVFINTDWCVDGMYKTLDCDEIKNGRFTDSNLDKIWDEPRFTDKKAELLKLMHQYHLCFSLKDGSGYITPDLLSPDKPHGLNWNHDENLHIEYRYDFMPAGILSRFIVKSHSFIKDNFYWKYGVVLEYENTLALVQEDYIHGRINIALRGRNKRGLLSAIRMNIDEIHRDFDKSNKLVFEEMIPCNCNECSNSSEPHFFKFDFLKKLEEKGKEHITCEKSLDDVPIVSMINDVQINSRDKTITTNRDLKDFILDILGNIEKEIRLKSSYIHFWRDIACESPKNETEFQPFISNGLDVHCKVKGIQLAREVREAEGNVDIILTTKNQRNEILKVCVEIKKAHHADVETAIKTQLPMYMESANTDAGIYLVIWLKNRHHDFPKKYQTPKDLANAIDIHRPTGRDISTLIFDCCKPVSPSKRKDSSKSL